MSLISLYADFAERLVSPDLMKVLTRKGRDIFRDLCENTFTDVGCKGWMNPQPDERKMEKLREKAEEVRKNADVFVLVGVGGSNQAARAVIKALQTRGDRPEILYAGNTLSSHYLSELLESLEGKSVYINVIAKNFDTLEPGSHFRVLRSFIERHWSKKELSKRVILTGSRDTRLERIAENLGCLFLEFPEDVGGRYSAFTPVGLFPMLVAGVDVDALLLGAQEQREALLASGGGDAVRYAAFRNAAYSAGYDVEILSFFEPRLEYFAKWWIQLFAESEGKKGKGIFPSAGNYSEDLHSLGQYVQEGRRVLLETFLSVEEPGDSVSVPAGDMEDGFDYLTGKSFLEINRCAEKATVQAHMDGGVPCVQLKMEQINEKSLGALFYFFMVSCAVSGKLLGINPFNQEGVEAYKRTMFQLLGKPGSEGPDGYKDAVESREDMPCR